MTDWRTHSTGVCISSLPYVADFCPASSSCHKHAHDILWSPTSRLLRSYCSCAAVVRSVTSNAQGSRAAIHKGTLHLRSECMSCQGRVGRWGMSLQSSATQWVCHCLRGDREVLFYTWCCRLWCGSQSRQSSPFSGASRWWKSCFVCGWASLDGLKRVH
jgi:hypothetical protein